MLITLAVSSLRSELESPSGPRLAMDDVPRFAHDELGLHGLSVSASMLAGWTLAQIERFRDSADKAACPCLLLADDEPLGLADAKDDARAAAVERLTRLATAANRLGCSSVAVGCKGKDGDEAFERAVTTLKRTIPMIDRLELSILMRPNAGILEAPARLTELIKRVGGFRIGSLPDFGHARRSGSAEQVLRKLAPYAGAILATTEEFDDSVHRGCDLASCVKAISSVGYQSTLAIEYVGRGNAVENIKKARQQLAAAISGDEPVPDLLDGAGEMDLLEDVAEGEPAADLSGAEDQ
jgi:hypothetical protein